MGEKIEFPLNDKFYFDQAIEYLMNEDFEKAIDNFEKVYANDNSFELNRLYAASLFTVERVDEALEVANDHKDTYTNSEELGVFYTMVLIKNHLFLEAEVLIQNHLSNSYSPFLIEWETANKELEKERDIVQLKKEQRIEECVKELNVIESFPPIKQSEIIETAHIVDLSELQIVANRIFINPQISPTTQKAFLELLITKEDPNNYTFNWIDGPRKVVPKELKTFEEVEIMKQVLSILESKLEKNPSFIESIRAEMINDLLILYPFSDEIITDAELWVELYLESFDLMPNRVQQSKHFLGKNKEMKKWHDYLNQLAQRNSY